MNTTRRKFIGTMTTLAATAGVASAWPRAFSTGNVIQGPVRVGLIGAKGMGWSDLNSMLKVPGVQCTALCDVDANVLNERAGELKGRGIEPKLYGKHEELLADPDVDVVIIGTPDHWHCLQLVDACAAGKDVYVEKPLGNSIADCQSMVARSEEHTAELQSREN